MDKRTSPRGTPRNKSPWIFGLAVFLLAVFFCCGALIPSAGGSAPEDPPGAGTPPPPSPSQGPEIVGDNWRLTLVNPWNTVPEDWTVTLVELTNGQAVDKRCYPDLQEMMDACRAAGLSPLICASYRTQAGQTRLFQNQVEQHLAQGRSRREAREEAARLVAVPGTSEHQLGLAVDIVDLNYQLLDRGQEDTPVQKWLMAHCWEYGFILRYPTEKTELTGIYYEPWHYRYVGRQAAREITRAGLCLEEYVAGQPRRTLLTG